MPPKSHDHSRERNDSPTNGGVPFAGQSDSRRNDYRGGDNEGHYENEGIVARGGALPKAISQFFIHLVYESYSDFASSVDILLTAMKTSDGGCFGIVGC